MQWEFFHNSHVKQISYKIFSFHEMKFVILCIDWLFLPTEISFKRLVELYPTVRNKNIYKL